MPAARAADAVCGPARPPKIDRKRVRTRVRDRICLDIVHNLPLPLHLIHDLPLQRQRHVLAPHTACAQDTSPGTTAPHVGNCGPPSLYYTTSPHYISTRRIHARNGVAREEYTLPWTITLAGFG